MTVLVSSHLLDVVQSICTRIALFSKGRIGFIGTLDAFARKVSDGAYHVDVAADGVDLQKLAGSIAGIAMTERDGDLLRITADRDIRGDLAKTIVTAGGDAQPSRCPSCQPWRSLQSLFRGGARCSVKVPRSKG